MPRHTRALTTLSALAAAAALTVGVPATASAQSWDRTDPAGDVIKYTYNIDTDEETEAVDPTITNGDVISSTIKHNPRKVIATLRFRDLAVTPEDLTIFAMSIRTDKGNRDMTVAAMKGHERGVRDFSRPNGHSVRCRGASHHIDYAAHTVTMVVPRSCLGRPRWVRAGALSARISGWADVVVEPARATDTPDPAIIESFVDDAHSKSFGDRMVLSPRLRRG